MKTLRILTAVTLLLSSMTSQSVLAAVPPAGYEDDVRLPTTNWFSDLDPASRIGIAANFLADHGIVGGFPDGTFQKDRLVNRAEMAKFITKADPTCDVDLRNEKSQFTDVLAGEWYVPYVNASELCEIVTGYPDGTFRPDKPVNTVEMLAMLSRAGGFSLPTKVTNSYSDVEQDVWYSDYVGVAQEKTFFPERTPSILEPSRSLTRGEVAYVLYLILSINPPPPPPPSGSDLFLQPLSVDTDVIRPSAFVTIHHVASELGSMIIPQNDAPKSTTLRWPERSVRLNVVIPSGFELVNTNATCTKNNTGYQCLNIALESKTSLTFRAPRDLTCDSNALYTATVTQDGTRDPNLQNNTQRKTFHVTCDLPSQKVGNLFVTQNAETFPSRQLLGGELGEPILGLDFLAKEEAINVMTIRFQTNNPAHTANAIDQLELFRKGETQPFAYATRSACAEAPHAEFCATMTNFKVEKEHTDVVFVRPLMKSDIEGGVSGIYFSIKVGPETDAILATGAQSLQALKPNDQDSEAEGEVFIGVSSPAPTVAITGKIHAIVMSKIISITNANPAPNGISVPTGTSPIGQFKFTTRANNNTQYGLNTVTLDAIIFNVFSQNVAQKSDGFFFYDKADPTKKYPCFARTTNGRPYEEETVTGSFLVLCTSFDASPIKQGAAKTYVLEAAISNPKVLPSLVSKLQVSLQDFNSIELEPFGITQSKSHIIWLDSDENTASAWSWIEYPTSVIYSTSYNS